MESNTNKIIITILVLIILIGGILFYRQGKKIAALSPQISGNQTAFPGADIKQKPAGNTLQESINSFSGKVTTVSGESVLVEADLTDFSKPKDPEKLKTGQPVNLKSADFEIMKKNITVSIAPETVFASRKQADIKVGDTINVSADKSPYATDAVTALQIQ